MTAAVRLRTLFWLLLFQALTLVTAHPAILISPAPLLLPRASPIVRNTSGTIQVFDPTTQSPIVQSPATDGSGSNFDVPALIWIGFCLLFGIPMACAGIRGWRLTTATGIGVTAAVLAWAAFINTVNSPGISDILLTFIVLGFFFLGFVLGVFEFARLGAIVVLSISGGLAFGIRIVVVKEGLLFAGDSLYVVNWVIVGVFGAAGGLVVIWAQRAGLLFACSSVGNFLTFLGIDLIMNKQSGMSRGLRILFDRNSSHLADVLTNGYSPSLLTKIFIIASLVLTPILAFAQHKIFKQPFNRLPSDSDSEMGIEFPTTQERKRSTFLIGFQQSVAKLKSPSRFSM